MTKQKNSKSNLEKPELYDYYSEQHESIIGLYDIWRLIFDEKLVITLIILLSSSIALTIALLTTPIFRAETLLAPVSKENSGGLSAMGNQISGIASLTGIEFSRRDNTTAESIATLNSREFTNKFISDEKLLLILFSDRWDPIKNEWKNNMEPPTTWQAYKMFNAIRKISVDKKTGFVTLGIEWKDPVLSAEWATKLVQRINDKLRQEAIIEAEKSIQYLENELEKTSVIQVKQSIYNLIEAQTKSKMLASTQQEYAFRVVDKAVVPEDKIRPKRKQIVIMGFVLGCVFGVFIAFIKITLSKKSEIELA